MEIYDRKLKKTVDEVDVNANTTKKLYDTFWGRVLVKILKRPFVTKFVGFVLSKNKRLVEMDVYGLNTDPGNLITV